MNASEIEKRIEKARMIEAFGLVVDAGNLKALENATLYDEKGLWIATTDSRGYFKGKVECMGEAAIRFKITVQKRGYRSFVQTENWGNIGNAIRCTYYFGITQSGSPFSEMVLNNDLSFDSVMAGFRAVSGKTDFSKKLKRQKRITNRYFLRSVQNII